jgi:hypothetical protein
MAVNIPKLPHPGHQVISAFVFNSDILFKNLFYSF